MSEQFGAFALDAASDGVALVVFSQPPVNAVSVYEDLGRLADRLEGTLRSVPSY